MAAVALGCLLEAWLYAYFIIWSGDDGNDPAKDEQVPDGLVLNDLLDAAKSIDILTTVKFKASLEIMRFRTWCTRFAICATTSTLAWHSGKNSIPQSSQRKTTHGCRGFSTRSAKTLSLRYDRLRVKLLRQQTNTGRSTVNLHWKVFRSSRWTKAARPCCHSQFSRPSATSFRPAARRCKILSAD